LRDPVADRAGGERAEEHLRHVELPRELPVDLEREGCAVAVARLLEERADAGLRVERAEAVRVRRLPAAQPLTIERELALERLRVADGDRPDRRGPFAERRQRDAHQNSAVKPL